MLAYDDSPCWAGGWDAPDPRWAMWAQSAVARTVRALPELHPLRLGDDKGTSGRVLAWCGAPDDGVASGLGVLTQLSPPPELGLEDDELPWEYELTIDVEPEATRPRAVAGQVGGYQEPPPGVRRWAGALAHIAGSWLPPVALLPTAGRDIDDPATSWSTESVDFAGRHSVHAEDLRLAADLLAPHVMALILDQVPDDAAVVVSGDALHVWWAYDDRTRRQAARVKAAVDTAGALVSALPTFVLADHPDRSEVVERRLEDRAAEAAAYRAARDARLAARRTSS